MVFKGEHITLLQIFKSDETILHPTHLNDWKVQSYIEKFTPSIVSKPSQVGVKENGGDYSSL